MRARLKSSHGVCLGGGSSERNGPSGTGRKPKLKIIGRRLGRPVPKKRLNRRNRQEPLIGCLISPRARFLKICTARKNFGPGSGAHRASEEQIHSRNLAAESCAVRFSKIRLRFWAAVFAQTRCLRWAAGKIWGATNPHLPWKMGRSCLHRIRNLQ